MVLVLINLFALCKGDTGVKNKLLDTGARRGWDKRRE